MRFEPATPRDRLIVALDFEDAAPAFRLVDELGDLVSFYKVGPRLFYESGAAAVDALTDRGKRVFLDLKFHDIPATVEGAVRQAAALGVTFATAHAVDGSAGAAAAEASRLAGGMSGPGTVGILAVTVLTSTSQEDLVSEGVEISLEELVVRRARAAIEAGCIGVVCAAQEVARLREELGDDPLLVTPGIRREGDAAVDQARIATPKSAIALGSDYLVVGRPIIEAGDPRSVVEQFVAEMD